MPKRLLLASVLLLAAVIAVIYWSDGTRARGNSRAAPVRPGADAVDIERDAPAAPAPLTRLFGRVVEEGTDAPVGGASVTAYGFATGLTLTATSAEDGTFDFPDAVAAGPVFQLVVRTGSHAEASLRAGLANEPIVVPLEEGGAIRGRVVSAGEDGTPVSPCRVTAFRTQPEDRPWDAHESLLRQLLPPDLACATTVEVLARRTGAEDVAYADGNGRFRLHVEPGVHEIDCRFDHLRAVERPRVDATAAAEPEPVTLRVVPDPNSGRILLDAKRRRMTIEQVRKAYDAQPFVPFVLHLADGRENPVRSREFMMAVPSGRTLEVYQPEGRRNVIDLLLVTDLEFESRARTLRGA